MRLFFILFVVIHGGFVDMYPYFSVKTCDIWVTSGPFTFSGSPAIKTHVIQAFWNDLFRVTVMGYWKFRLIWHFCIRVWLPLIRINKILLLRSGFLGRGFMGEFFFVWICLGYVGLSNFTNSVNFLYFYYPNPKSNYFESSKILKISSRLSSFLLQLYPIYLHQK